MIDEIIGIGLMLIILVIVVLNVYFSIRFFRRWNKFWKYLAILPLVAILIDAILILIDSSSHNLWPLELGLINILGLVYVLLIWFIHKRKY